MNIKNIFDMFKIKKLKFGMRMIIDADKALLGLRGSPTKVKKSMTKEPKGQGEL